MTDSPVSPAPAPSGLPRGVVIVLGIAAGVVVLAGMRSVASILAPIVLAVVLTVTVYPLRTLLIRKGVKGWLATLLLVLGIYAILIGLGVAFLVGIGRFASLLPTYKDQITDTINHLESGLASLGISRAQVQEVFQHIDPSTIINALSNVLAGLSSVASNLLFVIILVLFLGVDGSVFAARMKTVPLRRAPALQALQSFAYGTRQYFVVATVFGAIVAGLDWVAVFAFGIPAAGLWALLAFVTNYIPNIGFIIGLIPVALLALVTGGVATMIWIIVIYCVINFVIQSVIQPKFVGDAVGLTTTMSFLSLIVWSYVLGPLGAVLAIPVSLLVKAILVDSDDDARWLQLFLGDQPVHEVKDPNRPKRSRFKRKSAAEKNVGETSAELPPAPVV